MLLSRHFEEFAGFRVKNITFSIGLYAGFLRNGGFRLFEGLKQGIGADSKGS